MLSPTSPAAPGHFLDAALSATCGVMARLRPLLDRAAGLASMQQTHLLDPHLAADVGLPAYTTTLAERRLADAACSSAMLGAPGSRM